MYFLPLPCHDFRDKQRVVHRKKGAVNIKDTGMVSSDIRQRAKSIPPSILCLRAQS